MLYLGVHQSVRGTGLCVVDGAGTIARIETVGPCAQREADQVASLRQRLAADLRLQVRLAAFVGHPDGSHGTVFYKLGQLGGALRALAGEFRTPYVIVPLAGLKKFACGDRRVSGTRLLATARETLPIIDDESQAGAYFLAQIARRLSELWAAQWFPPTRFKQHNDVAGS
jgi:hypothetical protein